MERKGAGTLRRKIERKGARTQRRKEETCNELHGISGVLGEGGAGMPRLRGWDAFFLRQ